MDHKLRIHGDNILECENALKLLASSVGAVSIKLSSGPAYAPVFEFTSKTEETFEVKLFPGYGRWKFPLAEYIASLGGRLREAPDAVVTQLVTTEGKDYEKPIIAVEFSGALPAGNNAWQRTGRALALAYAGIPYLYFAELGGQELSAERIIKAARFPNPLVPFAYAALGAASNAISLPVYLPSPSSDGGIIEVFKDCFGTQESVELVKSILLSEDVTESKTKIEQKVLNVLKVLSEQRKRKDILSADEWKDLYSHKTGIDKAQWLIKKAMPWNKKVGLKGLPETFSKLLKAAVSNGAVAIGSKDMPICLVPAENRKQLAASIKGIYGSKVSREFIQWLSDATSPLLLVWVAGFKPRGDDSRPDRGLVPLARMVFGIENVDLLTVVYGPATSSTWKALETDMNKLAASNGLWEAIVNLSNGILVDSKTSTDLKQAGFLVANEDKKFEQRLLPAASEEPIFGEHDVDSVLHLLFSRGLKLGVYESLCNPPGGDWSGINVLEPGPNLEMRWTSLPRVSGADSKRPDHIIEFLKERTLLSIESKESPNKLEESIGPRLIKYVKDLTTKPPTAVRDFGSEGWAQYGAGKLEPFDHFSGGAFRYVDDKSLTDALKTGKVDFAFGVEFSKEGLVTIYVAASSKAKALLPKLQSLAENLKGLISVQTSKVQ